MSYHLDHDTGILRLSLDSDPNPEHALVSQLGPDGIYRDVETKVAIARAVGSNSVLIDLDLAPRLAPAGAERARDDDDDPKLCPAPTWVWYDDCREANGAMIEAKGSYATFLASDFGKDRLTKTGLHKRRSRSTLRKIGLWNGIFMMHPPPLSQVVSLKRIPAIALPFISCPFRAAFPIPTRGSDDD